MARPGLVGGELNTWRCPGTRDVPRGLEALALGSSRVRRNAAGGQGV